MLKISIIKYNKTLYHFRYYKIKKTKKETAEEGK